MNRRTFVTAVFSGIGLSLSGCSGQLPGQQTTQREVRTPGSDCDGAPEDRITVVSYTPEPVVAQVSVEDAESRVVFQEEISLPADDEADADTPTFRSDTVVTEPGTYVVTVHVNEPSTLSYKSAREYTNDCDRWEIHIEPGDVDDVRIAIEG